MFTRQSLTFNSGANFLLKVPISLLQVRQALLEFAISLLQVPVCTKSRISLLQVRQALLEVTISLLQGRGVTMKGRAGLPPPSSY